MEQFSIWITIASVLVFPFVGWIFNTLITNKINDLESKYTALEAARDLDKALFFKRLDDIKVIIESTYVRKDLYDQAMTFYNNANDAKFRSLIDLMTTQFESVEGKIDDLKKFVSDKVK